MSKWSHSRHRHRKHKIRGVGGCFDWTCPVQIVGIIFLIIGIAYLVSSTHDSRGDLIAEYNSAVDQWSSVGESEFLKLADSVSFVFETKTSSGKFLKTGKFELVSAESSDVIKDEPKSSTEVFKSYNKWKLVPGAFLLSSTQVTLSDTVSILIKETNNDSSLETTFLDSSFKPFKSNSEYTYCTKKEDKQFDSHEACSKNYCLNEGYRWDDAVGKCYADVIGSSFCVLLDTTSNSNSSLGNFPPSGQITGSSASDFCFSESLQGVSYGEQLAGNMTGEIRSSKDPYVILGAITKGNFNFGATKGENFKIGLPLSIIGSICLLIAWGKTLLSCILDCIYSPKYEYAPINSEGEQRENPTQDPEYPAQDPEYPAPETTAPLVTSDPEEATAPSTS